MGSRLIGRWAKGEWSLSLGGRVTMAPVSPSGHAFFFRQGQNPGEVIKGFTGEGLEVVGGPRV